MCKNNSSRQTLERICLHFSNNYFIISIYFVVLPMVQVLHLRRRRLFIVFLQKYMRSKDATQIWCILCTGNRASINNPPSPSTKLPWMIENKAATFWLSFYVQKHQQHTSLSTQASFRNICHQRHIFEFVITRNWFNVNLADVKNIFFLKFMVEKNGLSCGCLLYHVILPSYPEHH